MPIAARTAARRVGSHRRPMATVSSRQGTSHAIRRATADGSTRYASRVSLNRWKARNLWPPALANSRAADVTIKYPNTGSSKAAALGRDQKRRRRTDVLDRALKLAARCVINVEIRAVHGNG